MWSSITAMPITRVLAATVAALGFSAAPAFAQSTNHLQSIETSALTGNSVQLTLRLSDAAPTPLTFTVEIASAAAISSAERSSLNESITT